MLPLSVVIITKNEAQNIVACIRSVRTLSDDIVVVDAESKDETALLAEREGATVIRLKWNGYGHARNAGAATAKHDLILSLDADERIPPLFAGKLQQQFTGDATTVYGFKRRSFYKEAHIRYGTWGGDRVLRLYNRNVARWNAAPVHESLTGTFKKRYLEIAIDHYTVQSYVHYKCKSTHYAYLCAIKYRQEGKTANWMKRIFASTFAFIKSYFLLLGFLDGKRGLTIARMSAHYTGLKYHHLHRLTTRQQQRFGLADRMAHVRTDLSSFLK